MILMKPNGPCTECDSYNANWTLWRICPLGMTLYGLQYGVPSALKTKLFFNAVFTVVSGAEKGEEGTTSGQVPCP